MTQGTAVGIAITTFTTVADVFLERRAASRKNSSKGRRASKLRTRPIRLPQARLILYGGVRNNGTFNNGIMEKRTWKISGQPVRLFTMLRASVTRAMNLRRWKRKRRESDVKR